MGWLRFGLPLEEELSVEMEVRKLQACNDLEAVKRFAEQAFRAWVVQVDINGQLIDQLAEAEAILEGAGRGEPSEEHMRWAREIAADLALSPCSPAP
jgi:hypothetical protein